MNEKIEFLLKFLSIKDICFALNIARKDFSKKTFSISTTKKISNILAIYNVFKKQNISNSLANTYFKLNENEKNLLIYIKNNENYTDLLNNILLLDRNIKNDYNNSFIKKSKTEPNNNWLCYISIPHCEDNNDHRTQ